MNWKIVGIGLLSLVLQVIILVLDWPMFLLLVVAFGSSWFMFDRFTGTMQYSVFRQRLVGAFIFLFSVFFVFLLKAFVIYIH